jgi:F0F1-type ATP synthase assembly protein I
MDKDDKEIKLLETLTKKVEELQKTIKEKKEDVEGKIKENPLAYVAGSFAGGVIVGYLIRGGGNKE